MQFLQWRYLKKASVVFLCVFMCLYNLYTTVLIVYSRVPWLADDGYFECGFNLIFPSV